MMPEMLFRSGSFSNFVGAELKKTPSISMLQDNLSAKRFIVNGDREYMEPRYKVEQNCCGPLQIRQKKDFNYSTPGEDAAEGAFVERRGRFKVTSADVNLKDNHSNSTSGSSTFPTSMSISAGSFLTSLQCILQLNMMEREEILKMVEFAEQTSGHVSESTEAGIPDLSQIIPSSVKERELQARVIQMQQSIGSMVEELQILKAKNTQMERKLFMPIKKDDMVRE